MSSNPDHRAPVAVSLTTPAEAAKGPDHGVGHGIDGGGGGVDGGVDGGPPRRSKVAATLAVLACAACCALPVLIGAGLLTGAGAALAEQTLLAVAGLLLAAAAGMWWLHRRRSARNAPNGVSTCGPSACGCGGC